MAERKPGHQDFSLFTRRGEPRAASKALGAGRHYRTRPRPQSLRAFCQSRSTMDFTS
ncbi:hypothetical protein CADE109221_07710 [Castellaniella denitrificans]